MCPFRRVKKLPFQKSAWTVVGLSAGKPRPRQSGEPASPETEGPGKTKRLKAILRPVIELVVFVLLLLICFNPNRGKFNHAVFEGGRPNPITSNQEAMDKMLQVNGQCYQNESDPRVQRRNYLFFSIYDVRSGLETYHVLGILGMFRLLNPP